MTDIDEQDAKDDADDPLEPVDNIISIELDPSSLLPWLQLPSVLLLLLVQTYWNGMILFNLSFVTWENFWQWKQISSTLASSSGRWIEEHRFAWLCVLFGLVWCEGSTWLSCWSFFVGIYCIKCISLVVERFERAVTSTQGSRFVHVIPFSRSKDDDWVFAVCSWIWDLPVVKLIVSVTGFLVPTLKHSASY